MKKVIFWVIALCLAFSSTASAQNLQDFIAEWTDPTGNVAGTIVAEMTLDLDGFATGGTTNANSCGFGENCIVEIDVTISGFTSVADATYTTEDFRNINDQTTFELGHGGVGDALDFTQELVGQDVIGIVELAGGTFDLGVIGQWGTPHPQTNSNQSHLGGFVIFTSAVFDNSSVVRFLNRPAGADISEQVQLTSFRPVPSSVLKGDVNMDGAVNFLDISAFIAALSGGPFQAEADVNCDMAVNFLDISAFVAVLQVQ